MLPRAVFAQSRNTRLLASGMCSERAAFIHCLAPKQTDRYHRTKACRATCLHPRYEVHHPAKTFASGVKLDQVTRYPRVKLDQVTRYPLSPPILACGATLSCWLPLSRASKSFLFRRRVSAGQAGNVVTTNAQVTRLTLQRGRSLVPRAAFQLHVLYVLYIVVGVHPSRCRVRRGRPALGPPDSDTAAAFCGPVSRAVGAGRRPLF